MIIIFSSLYLFTIWRCPVVCANYIILLINSILFIVVKLSFFSIFFSLLNHRLNQIYLVSAALYSLLVISHGEHTRYIKKITKSVKILVVIFSTSKLFLSYPALLQSVTHTHTHAYTYRISFYKMKSKWNNFSWAFFFYSATTSNFVTIDTFVDINQKKLNRSNYVYFWDWFLSSSFSILVLKLNF
jgi:hypothetical protein